jgi:hypothetical protein
MLRVHIFVTRESSRSNLLTQSPSPFLPSGQHGGGESDSHSDYGTMRSVPEKVSRSEYRSRRSSQSLILLAHVGIR